jgi:hypothetical protein
MNSHLIPNSILVNQNENKNQLEIIKKNFNN